MIREVHGPDAVQLEFTGELINKPPNFPVILMHPYTSSDKELFPLIDKPPLDIPPLEEEEEKKIVKVLQEKKTRNKEESKYLVGYKDPDQEDQWIIEKYIKNSDRLSRRFIH
ncbi:hypothetical protein O181_027029 [Austropuccinia psidii MF-1]|uniref:Chromo domain-containing protein n=1 Tax=Austropuccinia psidii MF-1 TaxID=1389203 RepID=A0A9Q3H274_9BASI|nr:hypothetical protein [Austropuccinia psidii MF-1]